MRIGTIYAAAAFPGTVMATSPAFAQGLQKVKGTMEDFQYELTTIIPVVAAILLMMISVGYMAKVIDKADFFRWFGGVVVAGSSAQIVAWLF